MQKAQDGRDSDGLGSGGIIEEKEREAAGGSPQPFASADGQGTDGEGSPGILEEKGLETSSGDTGETSFGSEGDDTDGAGSGGILAEKEAEAADLNPDEEQQP